MNTLTDLRNGPLRQVDRWPGRFEQEADTADAGINLFDLGENGRRWQEMGGREEGPEKPLHG